MRTPGRPAALLGLLGLVGLVGLLAAGCGASSDTAGPATTPPATAPPATTAVPCGTSRTVPYASHPGVDPNLTSLDVHLPPADATGTCTGRALVVWVHGGGWTGGDKSEYMDDKIRLFNDAGWVFASVNYRLTDKTATPPAPTWPVHDADTADAVSWLVDHAAVIGADGERVAVLGHSAGGGITSAIATDPQYLARHGHTLDDIDCAASMDGEGYDIVAGATTTPPEVQQGYRNVFGSDPAAWEEASPVRHVAPGAGIPDFFVAARGADWRLELHAEFITALRAAGVPVTVLDSRELEHADLAVDVGAPDDTVVTPALMAFLTPCLAAP